jgi:TP901 family phage tail tape measure protein
MTDFQATLSLDISKAMADAKKFESYMTSLQSKSTTNKSSGSEKEAAKSISDKVKIQEKAQKDYDKLQEKAYKDNLKYSEKIAKENAKALDKELRDNTKAYELKQKEAAKSARTMEKTYAQQVIAQDKAESKALKSAKSPVQSIVGDMKAQEKALSAFNTKQIEAARLAEGFGMKMKRALFTVNGEMQGMAVTMGIIGAKVLFWTLMTGAVFGTIGAIKGLFTALKDIDYTLIELEKVVADFADSDEQLNKYMESSISIAKVYGREFGVSFTIGLKAMRDFVRMGRTVEEAQLLTRTAMAAVNIAAFSQDDAIKSLTSTIHQFNMSASDSMRILDAWNSLENKSGATAQDLAAATEKTGSAFKLVGASMHELNAISSAMIKVTGESGDTVGTTLKMMASRYADVNMRQSAGNVLWKTAGITIINADKSYKSFTETLAELSGVWGKLDDIQKATILKSMAGARHFSQAAAIMNSWDQVIKNLTLSLDSAGSSMTENDRFMRSWQKQLELAGASIQELADTSRKAMIPALIDMTKYTTSMIYGLSTLTESGVATNAALLAIALAATKVAFAFNQARIAGTLFTKSNAITLGLTAIGLGLVYMAEKAGKSKNEMENLNASFQRQSEEARNLYKNYSDLGKSFAVFQATYQGQIKSGKDGKNVLDQLNKALDKEGISLTQTQKDLVKQALSMKDLTTATKTFYEVLNQVKNDVIINKLKEQQIEIDALAKKEQELFDKRKNRQTRQQRLGGKVDTSSLDTEYNNIRAERAKKILENKKLEQELVKTPLVPEVIKPGIDMESLLEQRGKALKYLLETQKAAINDTELYNEKLEKLASLENIVTIALAKEGRVYDESAVKKQILITRSTLLSEKYVKLKNDLDKSNESYLNFLNVSKKVADSYNISTKNMISYANGITTLNEKEKNLIEARIEKLSIDDASKIANREQIIALDNILQRNEEFERQIKDQKTAVKSTIEEISSLAASYANLADIADGTGKVISGSLKTALKETFLSFNLQKGFDVTKISDSFTKVTEDIKEKFATNISEGIIGGIYTTETEAELDRLANSITKAFTGPSEKDKRLEEFKNATQALNGLFGENQIAAIIKNPEQAALIEATSAEIETQLKLINATESLTTAILGKSGTKPSTAGTKTSVSGSALPSNISSNFSGAMNLKELGIQMPSIALPTEMQSMFSTMGAGFGQGGITGSIGAQLLGAGKEGTKGATSGGGIGGAIGSIFGPTGTIVGSILGSLAGGLFGGEEDRKQKQRQKEAKKAVNDYNDALNRMSPSMDETREKMDALTKIIKKVGKAGGDTSQYSQELARLSSPEQSFKDRLETLQHNVAMTRDENVGNKKYLQGLIDLQKRYSNQLTMQTRRWLDETVFKLQQDVQITATVRSDADLDRLVRDVTRKISLSESLRGQSFIFQ